jgi:hypothetical protein
LLKLATFDLFLAQRSFQMVNILIKKDEVRVVLNRSIGDKQGNARGEGSWVAAVAAASPWPMSSLT